MSNYVRFMENYPQSLAFLVVLWIALLIWSLVWKGWALWVAARKGSKGWFVALLIVNTLGILEILYIYVFSKKSSVAAGTPPEIKTN